MFTSLLFALTLGVLSPQQPCDACEGDELNGVRQGMWTCYYSDGTPMEEGSYVNGEKEGHWKIYHANGKLATEGDYSAGVESGHWIFYGEDGEILFEENF